MEEAVISERKSMSKWWQSPVALIRISSVLYVVTAIGHASAYPWASARDPREVTLVDSMKALPFVFLGERSTYWNLYFGWGNLIVVCLVAFSAILWFLSDLARVGSRGVGAISWVISAASLVGAWISLRFFYVPPFLTYLVSSVFLAMAAMQLRRQEGH